MSLKCALPFAAAVMLTACGGQSIEENIDLTPPATRAFLDHSDDLDRVNAIPNSAFSAVAMGTATFEGTTAMVFVTGAGTRTLVGDADISADFDRQIVSGRLHSFAGLESGVDYNGSFSLSNGEIGGTRPNTFSADFGGSLTGGGVNQIVANGSIDGVFKGTPVRGLTATGQTDFVNFNGSGVVGATAVSIVAE
ncbi:hypothetical protein SAMN04488515_0357 [Cognatiyoonia koreensis]|uniref:Transferrin-binding protein B C-lobe/N-lobe beta barrel domain-containing protein n=1 Tax=Cognatiyoonia koreensis TaxID=364200 RepID=A0A1I0N1X8_9RHOB|nr:hypothetical protein [Cognatiyoonia koreensis]SEV94747.1 hypothetical protein SAMN04488515_0357 [Cognatiyoonia koreensis]